jgi:RHS repeat-associated protein
LPRTRARAKIASRKKFVLYTQFASKNLRQVLERTRKNALAYDRVASGGSFLSIDPVTTDANTGGSFNRYAYAANNPFKYVDPDGRDPDPFAVVEPRRQVGVRLFDTRLLIEAYKRLRDSISSSEPKRNDTAETPKSDTTSAPPVPGELVGDQRDSRSGQSGKRHTSGTLTPANGGTGDAEKDFDHLTGGTGKPVPTPNTYPPGTQRR